MPSPLQTQLLRYGARAASSLWPVAARLFPEKLELDDNRAYWAAQTPDYQPCAPLRGDTTADLAIIGGGFTGVSTAYHFSARYPHKRVVLLEAKRLANGASGRNGGMMLNWLADNPHHDLPLMARIYQTTAQGIQTILDIIARHQLDVSYRMDGTLTVYTDPARAEAAHAEVERLRAYGVQNHFLDKGALAQKLALEGVYGAVEDPFSGQINGAQLVRALRPILEARGVAIYEHTPALSIREGRRITIATPQGSVSAKALVLATNGYTGKLGYFRHALFPLHSHVVAAGPFSPEQQAAMGWRAYAAYADDLDRISYASLTPQGYLIFGGGSNQAYAYLFNNRTAYLGDARKGFGAVEARLRAYLPRSADVPIAYRWTGTLGITLNRQILMGVTGAARNIYYAIGYCGHGVTLANMAGEILTDMYSGDDERWRGLPFYRAPIQPIPPEPFRWLGYQVFTRLTGRSPRV